MQKLVIVSEETSFIVATIMKMMSTKGLDVTLAVPTRDDFAPSIQSADGLVIFTGTYVGYPAIVGILRQAMEFSQIKCILIGDTSSVFKLKENLPKDLICTSIENFYSVNEINAAIIQHLITVSNESRKKLLLVDDDSTFLKVVRIWLQDDYDVVPVNSGAQALQYLATNRPDLILLDYEMPILNGPQVLQSIRSEDSIKDIPVFFLTGIDSKEAVKKAVALKPAGYILKTQDKNKLLNTLKLYFSNQSNAN